MEQKEHVIFLLAWHNSYLNKVEFPKTG
uniref:Uncharacterized protein n=1 Tax=Rhizophora mucronata TaxID=61149 RepID=A0A2P2R1T2_RHIMU